MKDKPIEKVIEMIMKGNPMIILKLDKNEEEEKYSIATAGGKNSFCNPLRYPYWFNAIAAMIDFDVSVGPIVAEGEFFKSMEKIFAGQVDALIFSKLSNGKFAIHSSPIAKKMPVAIADSVEKAVNCFSKQFPPA